MTEYINKEKLINDIENVLWDWDTVDGITATTVLKQTITDIKNQPTADVTEVKHGHWINDGYACGDTQWTCSVCGEYEFRAGKRPYCCNCGAKMDEEAV